MLSLRSKTAWRRPSASGEVAIIEVLFGTPNRPAQELFERAQALGLAWSPTLAELKPGETVLDLGTGGGIDVLLSVRRVGPAGKVYGLDMTDEMLALAREGFGVQTFD